MANNFPNLKPALSLDMVNGIYVDPRITFSRAGTRTYFGREVVKAEENLLRNSNGFTNTAYWTLENATGGAVADPNGGTDATRLTAAAGNTTHAVNGINNPANATNNAIAYAAGSVLTYTIRAKAGTHDFIQIVQQGITGAHANFNLSTGTVGDVIGVGLSASASMTESPASSGWYTCRLTFTPNAALTTGGITVVLVASNTAARREAFNAAGTETVDIFQSQIEQRSFATAYTPTTTQPITRYQRLLKTAAANEWPREFDPVTGECLGRSVWESRTNRCLHSEDFGNAAWVKTDVTVATNQTIAPDGTLTADQLTASAGNGTVIQDLGAVASAAKTGSLYLKRYTGTGNIEITLNGGSTWTAVTLTNTWTRFNLTATLADEDFGIRIVTSGDSIFAWGGMVETGGFMTPYIPTVASQVTRLADSAVMTGVNFSSWYGGDRGTLFVDAETLAGSVGVNRYAVIEAGAGGRLSLGRGDATQGNRAWLDTSNGISPYSAISASGFNGKLAGSFGDAGVTFAYNGAITGTPSTNPANAPRAADTLIIGGLLSGGQRLNGYIKRLTYYNQALTSANLQAITR
jgi:hypothetical protein